MDIVGTLRKKKRRALIITEDGVGLRGIIAEHSGVCTEHCFPPGTPLKKILEFGKEQHAESVLFLQTSDLKEVEVKLGADLNQEERRSAIEYAAASHLGDHSGNQRISFMDGMFHDFRSGILVSWFDTAEVISLRDLVKGMKMKFLGITNFKQLLLAQHFSDPDHHGDAFLFLIGSHGVAAIPERNKLTIRNLPFGLPEPGSETEWKERVQRRLNTIFRNKRVCLYAPEWNEGFCELLQDICESESIEPENWNGSVSGSAVYFLQTGEKLIHPALPPPKEKDPKASGTYLGLFFLAAVLLSLGFLIGRNCITKYIFERDIAESQEIIDTVQKEKDTLKSLEKQLSEQQEIFAVLKQKQRVSKDLLLTLNLLARYSLQYSRITRIEEKSNGIFLEGESVWQPDLSRFFSHFESELSKHKLTLFSDGLSKDKDGKIMFRSRIAPAGGNQK